ncbi:MAG: NERD domain-containing protein [Treponema sp.]|jgi:hypothetical protein|nr:NERD domain-containing protein [Treponema sp.]
MMNDENREKGARAETLFAQYLDGQGIPYYHIDQDRETYSDEFYKKHIRRPDYIIHTGKGLFHVDVKYRTKMNFGENGEKRFYLNIVDSHAGPYPGTRLRGGASGRGC